MYVYIYTHVCIYEIYHFTTLLSFPFLRCLNILGRVLRCQNLSGLGGANSLGFFGFVAFGDAASRLPWGNIRLCQYQKALKKKNEGHQWWTLLHLHIPNYPWLVSSSFLSSIFIIFIWYLPLFLFNIMNSTCRMSTISPAVTSNFLPSPMELQQLSWQLQMEAERERPIDCESYIVISISISLVTISMWWTNNQAPIWRQNCATYFLWFSGCFQKIG